MPTREGPTSLPAGLSRGPGDRARRLGWFVLLWAASVAGLGCIALPLRWLLKAA